MISLIFGITLCILIQQLGQQSKEDEDRCQARGKIRGGYIGCPRSPWRTPRQQVTAGNK